MLGPRDSGGTPMTPITPVQTSPGAQVNNDMFTRIMNRFDSMDKKLVQLDYIQSSINNLTLNVQSMESRISEIESNVKDIEQSRRFDSSSIEKIDRQQKELDSLIQKMKSVESQQTKEKQEFKDEIQDLRCRSMRDNLMFYNIPEDAEENCERKVLSFIDEKLKIPNAAEIGLHRAQRAAKQLKGTNFGISEQYPREVMEKRRKLIPIMIDARKQGKDACIRVDKLFIDKQLYKESD
ncbi:uncharacterized protein LOC128219493 [Mya arenaria]|uniref:uncharacterized protein LOC128219493 n=1 Tax=Mya arenaria TaxID=6604 RepID=UPI0022E6EF3D|nr:uncharacterized protein LOC128219493 [Mya arenaria]